MDLRILYEDNHLVVVNKPHARLVQGDQTGDLSLDHQIREFIEKKYDKPGRAFLGVVHRLDRPVSGVVVFAKTSKALSRLNRAFKEHKVQKKYWAIVENPPREPEGTLVHYLMRNRKINKSKAFDSMHPDSKKAILTYRFCGQARNYYFLEIDLQTGRHHQIRAQLTAIGCTIKGDLKYGARRSNPGGGISLHARELGFMHPVRGEMMVIAADPPDEPLWHLFSEMAS